MRISDWSSDVCSSDLSVPRLPAVGDDEKRRIRQPAREPAHDPMSPSCGLDGSAMRRFGMRPAIRARCPASTADRIARAIRTGSRAFATAVLRSEEHTSELQSLMRISYAVFCLKKKNNKQH